MLEFGAWLFIGYWHLVIDYFIKFENHFLKETIYYKANDKSTDDYFSSVRASFGSS